MAPAPPHTISSPCWTLGRRAATSDSTPAPPTHARIKISSFLGIIRASPADASGFQVDVQIGNGFAYVLVGHSHYSFNLRSGPPEPVIQRALEVVRQLLSPMMRLREFESNRKPYRWLVEKQVNGNWELELEEGLVLFNYLGKRTEHVTRTISYRPLKRCCLTCA